MPKPIKRLQASAGSGKTFSLAVHYLTLLFSNDNKYREILAVTFTNKATTEMKTRILEVLEALAKGFQNDKTESYRIKIQAAHPQLNASQLQQKADKIYREVLHHYSRFAVNTIDGFVQKVIRSFAFELGLQADYTVEMNTNKVKTELVQKLDSNLTHNQALLNWIIELALKRIAENKSWNYKTELNTLIDEVFKDSYEVFENAIIKLNPEQLNTLFNDYASLTKKEINGFENEFKTQGKHAVEIFEKHAIDTSQLKGSSRSWLCKLEALKNLDFERAEKIFELIDYPENWFKAGKEVAGFYETLNPILKKLRIFQLKHQPNYHLAIAFDKNLYYIRLMQEIALLLKDYRYENGHLLISDAQKLITGITDDANDNPSFIWEKVGHKYRNFLFDEFQDTSTNQWKSFRSILANAIASPSRQLIDHLIVGDTKQAIYRWRSGDYNILHQQVKEDFSADNVLDDYLEENYRSAENIIHFNNHLYQKMPLMVQDNLNDAIKTKSDELQQWWHQMKYNDTLTSIYNKSAQKLPPNCPKGGIVKVKFFDKENTKETILDDVIQELSVLWHEKKYPLKDMAILVRTNAEAVLVVNCFMENKIPVLSGEALMIANNSAIQLLINTLKIWVGVDSETALYKANCIALYHRLHGKNLNPAAYLHLSRQSLSSLTAWLPASLCQNWQNWLQLPFIEIIEKLIVVYQLDTHSQHITYLLAFRDLIANATRMGEKGIIHFLNWWEEDGLLKTLPSPDEANAVQVITIHKAKGLDFRAVFVPFCNWNFKPKPNRIFWVPSAQTAYKELNSIPLRFSDDLANSAIAPYYYKEWLDNSLDALNMLYVATTRAKDYLYLATIKKDKIDKPASVGDALMLAINAANEDGKRNNSTEDYEIIEETAGNHKENHLSFEQAFELPQYPSTNRLSALYVPQKTEHIPHLLNTEPLGRLGSVKHEVLANAADASQVKAYLHEMLMAGTIAANELEKLENEVMEVLNHPEIKAILAQAEESIAEKNIIDADGKLHRPDRILINQHQVTILDYKFTATQSEKHIKQVLDYKKLLTNMGFVNIKGYLFYAHTHTLKLVE